MLSLKTKNLRFKFFLAFSLLAFAPLFVAGVFVTIYSYTSQIEQVKDSQKLIALRAGEGVTNFFKNLVVEIVTMTQTNDLNSMGRAEQEDILQTLIFGKSTFGHHSSRFHQFRLINNAGETTAIASLVRREEAESEWLLFEDDVTKILNENKELIIGPVRFSEITAEPMISLVLALYDYSTGEPVSHLVSIMRLKSIWSNLEQFVTGFNSSVFLLNSDLEIIAHPDPSVVLSQRKYALPEEPGVNIGLSNNQVVSVWHTITFGEQSFLVVAEKDFIEAIAPIRTFILQLAMVMVGAVIASLFLILWVFKNVISPIEELTGALMMVGGGDLSTRINFGRGDEIGYLASHFNKMAQTLMEHDADLKNTNSELVRINKELDDFTYIASHDLQEPLRKITAFGDLLLSDMEKGDHELVRKDLSYIHDATSRMQTLIQDLLDFSRSGRIKITIGDTSLSDCVEDALDSLAIMIGERGAVVVRESLPNIKYDKKMLVQVYQNLIANGVKYNKSSSPKIWITAQMENGNWILGVRDNGAGINPAYHEQIFQPFKRLQGRDESEGSGIGLAICRKIIERLGGTIWVESQEGNGAHFKFTLKRIEESETQDGYN